MSQIKINQFSINAHRFWYTFPALTLPQTKIRKKWICIYLPKIGNNLSLGPSWFARSLLSASHSISSCDFFLGFEDTLSSPLLFFLDEGFLSTWSSSASTLWILTSGTILPALRLLLLILLSLPLSSKLSVCDEASLVEVTLTLSALTSQTPSWSLSWWLDTWTMLRTPLRNSALRLFNNSTLRDVISMVVTFPLPGQQTSSTNFRRSRSSWRSRIQHRSLLLPLREEEDDEDEDSMLLLLCSDSLSLGLPSCCCWSLVEESRFALLRFLGERLL